MVEPIQFGGYAEKIIASPTLYNGIELHGVSEFLDPECGIMCEQDDDDPQYWSVYVHLIEGGCDCVGDFETEQQAIDYAHTLRAQYGWEILL